MKFRTKLIAGFSCVVFLISVILGVVYYNYNARRVTDMTRQNMRFYSRQLASGVDALVDSMKQVSDYILSDPDMLYAMQSMPFYHEKGKEMDRKNQVEVLTSGISLDYIIRNFYRVIIFNEIGDVACSTNNGSLRVDTKRDVSEIPWLETAAEQFGKPILVGPHEDGWGVRTTERVFSLARKVHGGDFGYIEVQNSVETLERVFELSDPNAVVLAWLPDGTLLYESKSLDEQDFIYEALQKSEKGRVDSTSVAGNHGIFSAVTSEKFGIQVAVVQSDKGLTDELITSVFLAAALSLGCFLISMVVVIIIANRLSGPITSLRKQMENTGIENLDAEPEILNTDDEMEALGIAYQKLIKRLNESMIKEKRLSLLQLQAQFDTLQAQVNPHFLYNVLNTISNRGIIDEDEQICEICGSLAAMLRYSSNNKERYATVEEELEYLDQYIYLLKSRYEHRLEVEVSCDEGIKKEILPKIVLQQLVENSIQHGYTNSGSVMKLKITGWREEKAWYIRVQDNGEGITPEIMAQLEQKMENIRENILMRRSNIEMEIGGMGLANTYARMFLLYAQDVVFSIENTEDGCNITIGVDR